MRHKESDTQKLPLPKIREVATLPTPIQESTLDQSIFAKRDRTEVSILASSVDQERDSGPLGVSFESDCDPSPKKNIRKILVQKGKRREYWAKD